MLNRTLSHFRIIAKLGEGGMGVVYRARDEKLFRDVALKVPPPHMVENVHRRQRFLREARLAAAVNHPSIATIHEVDEVDGVVFIVMELVEGETLQRLLWSSGALSLDRLFDISIQIAEGLAEAHSRRIVHRDLKPGNVMVSPGGKVKILDFGLAKALSDPDAEESAVSTDGTVSTEWSREAKIVGTFTYMSPEQARGKPVDRRSDLFTFGIMLYEMATGNHPFRAETEPLTLARIVEREPASLSAGKELPEGLQRIVTRCLQKDPTHRYHDTRDLVVDLQDLREEAVSSTVSTGSPRPSTLTGGKPRHRAGRWGLLAAALLVAAGVGFYSLVPGPWRPGSPRQLPTVSESVIAVFPFSVRGGEEFSYLGDAMVNLLSTTLDGAGEVRAVDPRALLGVVAGEGEAGFQADQGRRLARRLGAGRFVLGDVVEAGGNLRINASLYDSDGGPEPLEKVSVEGTAAGLFGLIDDLTAQLLAAQMGGPATRFPRIAAVTTESVPALKAFLEGEGHLWAGRFMEALEDFQLAVRIDPTFSLAFYRLSVAAEWLTRGELAMEAAEKAAQNAGRLSEHDRLLLEAYSGWQSGAGDEAERRYRAIVDSYPDDVEAWFQLGEVLFHYGPPRGRPILESRPAWERVLTFERDHALAMIHLARIAASEGDHPALDTMVDRILELNPNSDRKMQMLSMRVFSHGDREEQDRFIAGLRSESFLTLAQSGWEVAVFVGDLPGAARIYDILTDPARSREERAFGHFSRAHLDLAGGHWQEAKRQLALGAKADAALALEYRALLSAAAFLTVPRTAIEALRAAVTRLDADSIPPNVSPTLNATVHNEVHPHLRVYLLGLLSAKLGDSGAAAGYIEELEQVTGSPGCQALGLDLSLGIRGHLAWQEGNIQEALDFLEDASMETSYVFQLSSPFFSQAYQRYLRAEVFESLGRYEEAILWYSSFTGYSTFDLIHVAPSLYRRARLYERLGRPEEASRYYHRFIELWKDCDPELRPMVDDARGRLAALAAD